MPETVKMSSIANKSIINKTEKAEELMRQVVKTFDAYKQNCSNETLRLYHMAKVEADCYIDGHFDFNDEIWIAFQDIYDENHYNDAQNLTTAAQEAVDAYKQTPKSKEKRQLAKAARAKAEEYVNFHFCETHELWLKLEEIKNQYKRVRHGPD